MQIILIFDCSCAQSFVKVINTSESTFSASNNKGTFQQEIQNIDFAGSVKYLKYFLENIPE